MFLFVRCFRRQLRVLYNAAINLIEDARWTLSDMLKLRALLSIAANIDELLFAAGGGRTETFLASSMLFGITAGVSSMLDAPGPRTINRDHDPYEWTVMIGRQRLEDLHHP